MRFAGTLLLAAAAIVAAPVHAQVVSVEVAAGRVGDAAAAIARQTGTSIVVTDRVLTARRVPAIRGSLSAEAAIRRLARAAGARAVKVGDAAWRLVPAKGAVARRRGPASGAGAEPQLAAAPQPPAEPIVVVGSKRDIPVSDYPGQVEVIDGHALTFGGVGGTEKITQRVPTVSSTHLGSGRNKLFIRGIADSSFTGPTQSTVGQYFGDLRLSYNAPDPDLRLSDLERVEVLEGPQGTLYGAGSLGGILRLVPNEPRADYVSGSAMLGGSATQHGALGADGSAAFNLPLVEDRLALRIAANAETQGGYIDKPLLGRSDVNRTNIFGGRAALRLEAGDGWTIDLIGIGQTTAGRDSQYADREGDPLARAARVGEGFDADFLQGQFVLSGEIGTLRFRSSTGYTDQGLEERYDATVPDGPDRIFTQVNDTSMFANETRLWQPLEGRFGWILGASYTRNRTVLTRKLGIPDALETSTGVENGVDEVTLYGEGSLRIFDGLIATAGGRFTRSWLEGEGEDVPLSLVTTMAREYAALTAQRVENTFLPSGSVVATVAPDTTLYFRYQEGFRPGGLAISGDFVTQFRNDHVANIEFGGRHGQDGSGPFDLAANVSFTRWNDIQADYIDQFGLPSTANIGDGRIWSATLTGGVQVTPALRLTLGLTYNDSKVDEPLPLFVLQEATRIPELSLEQITQVPNIAEFAGRVGFDYARPLAGDLTLTAQGWAHYVGKSRLGIGPELGELQGDYLDTGLTVRVGRGGLGLTVSLTNLTDEKGNRFALGTPFAVGRDQITPLRPRTLRIGLDAAF